LKQQIEKKIGMRNEMILFYILSILFNAVAGYILTVEDEEGTDIETGLRLSANSETFRLILGVLTMVAGLLKLLSPAQGDIPVVGDLVPALLGLLSGFVLVFSYYRNKTSLESEEADNFGRILAKNKRWIGFVALASAALHFLFPSVLFL
jgi:membrane associated rhomboid family serine protease